MDNIVPDANLFLIVEDQKASGTDGGTFTSGAWQTRDLITEGCNNISGAGVVSIVAIFRKW